MAIYGEEQAPCDHWGDEEPRHSSYFSGYQGFYPYPHIMHWCPSQRFLQNEAIQLGCWWRGPTDQSRGCKSQTGDPIRISSHMKHESKPWWNVNWIILDLFILAILHGLLEHSPSSSMIFPTAMTPGWNIPIRAQEKLERPHCSHSRGERGATLNLGEFWCQVGNVQTFGPHWAPGYSAMEDMEAAAFIILPGKCRVCWLKRLALQCWKA